MAILHRATITPSKQELLDQVIGEPVEIVGSYRFDDPAGEVGVEGFVVRAEAGLRHVVLTYRGAPLEGATLVSTMEHSVLGSRWVYDGSADPVAIGCSGRALRGEQEQAVMEVWDQGELVATREPTITLSVKAAPGSHVRLLRELDSPAGPGLVASWNGGGALVAVLEG